MANEAGMLTKFSDLEYFGITAATAFTKGTVMVLASEATSSNMQVRAHAAANEFFAGVVAADNIADEANGNITLRTRGRFKFIAGGTIAPGNAVTLGATANQVVAANIATLSYTDYGKIIGIALTNATSGNEVIVWRG